MRRSDFASYVFLALAWGLSFLVLLKVVHAFGWIGAVTLRSLVAGMTIVILAMVTRRRLDFSAGWIRFAAVGATTVAGQLIGLSWATPIIGTATAAILVAAIPLFSMVIGQVWGLERIRPEGLIGLAMGTIGIVLLVGFPAVPLTGCSCWVARHRSPAASSPPSAATMSPATCAASGPGRSRRARFSRAVR
jgi:drug/metabolite transporter (DMT)-like permease